jgi:hypothetical protein
MPVILATQEAEIRRTEVLLLLMGLGWPIIIIQRPQFTSGSTLGALCAMDCDKCILVTWSHHYSSIESNFTVPMHHLLTHPFLPPRNPWQPLIF